MNLSYEAYLEILRQNRRAFTEKCFYTIEGERTQYKHNWHIDCINDHLEACESKDIKRLIICMPPRSMKSILVTVGWPARLLGEYSGNRVYCGSYANKLSLQHSIATQKIMMSQWYKELYPETIIDPNNNTKSGFLTTDNGFRKTTSVGGTFTGDGGDYLVLDDALKPDEAPSEVVRDGVNYWVDEVFMQRLNSKDSVVVIVMQRLHENDPVGHLLDIAGNTWETLILPSEFDKKTIIPTKNRTYIAEKNDLLWPSRLDATYLKEKKDILGEYGYASQYLQCPVPRGGGIVKKVWLRFYKERPVSFDYIIYSWDCASSTKDESMKASYSAGTLWGARADGFYLLRVINERLDYTDLKDLVLAEAYSSEVNYLLIENAHTGIPLITELQKKTRLCVIGIPPIGNKTVRLEGVTDQIRGGNVHFPEDAPWLKHTLDQLTTFPKSSNDDIVDSISQFLGWAKENIDIDQGDPYASAFERDNDNFGDDAADEYTGY